MLKNKIVAGPPEFVTVHDPLSPFGNIMPNLIQCIELTGYNYNVDPFQVITYEFNGETRTRLLVLPFMKGAFDVYINVRGEIQYVFIPKCSDAKKIKHLVITKESDIERKYFVGERIFPLLLHYGYGLGSCLLGTGGTFIYKASSSDEFDPSQPPFVEGLSVSLILYICTFLFRIPLERRAATDEFKRIRQLYLALSDKPN